MLKDLVEKNRTYRRFYEEEKVDIATLKELVNLARLTPSAANLQPLKYFISCDRETNGLIFPHLAWAGYLKEWPGPGEGERPSGYIIILGDTEIAKTFGCDHGIAAQTIMLGAVEKGLGGCMIASIQKRELKTKLNLADHLEVLLVLALGKPKEVIHLESIRPDDDVKYWRDEEQHHHVPKRALEDILINHKIVGTK